MSTLQATCAVDGCDRSRYRRDWCSIHYERWRRHGDSLWQPLTLVERFWAKVDKRGPEACWMWTGARNAWGYGKIGRGGQGAGTLVAHRLSWEWAHGAIPDGLWVLHRCDNPSCVNPAHLFLGTHLDNMADMRVKGRGRNGERSPNAKLTAADVREIRAATGVFQKVLAERYGVTQSAISNIRAGKRWAALTDDTVPQGGEDGPCA